jgi:hypothetical protein
MFSTGTYFLTVAIEMLIIVFCVLLDGLGLRQMSFHNGPFFYVEGAVKSFQELSRLSEDGRRGNIFAALGKFVFFIRLLIFLSTLFKS